MSLEIERKYLDVPFDELEKKLFSAGFLPEKPHLEQNVILDTGEASLYAARRLLRLRKKEWDDKVVCCLTYKEPVQEIKFLEPDKVCKDAPSMRGTKIREELETEIGDFGTALDIFKFLGYEIWANYEKIRQEWRFPAALLNGSMQELAAPRVFMDILSFANVVEIEGQEELITRAELQLGLDKFKKSSTNYHKLHQIWRQKNCLPPQRDFIFEPAFRQQWRKKLGISGTANKDFPE